ncbi:S8 family serine peptidase [Actinophytocola sp.]|uniref:S8 family serine peptidase n=1 Tax=Actinophytocola sp. TaxID=1872138 RepID=UPI002ED00768
MDRDDQLADFSNRGREGGGLKPEITAPGVGIVAPKVGGGHVAMSGTSMATPHVAGAAAILAGQHPDWTADQLKAVLMGSAKPNGSVLEQGAGRVDVAKASAATVFASVTVIDHGVVQWPHGDDAPIEKTITYTNTGAEPVTLDLAADVAGAPQGMFTFAPARLTVPAGGQASTTVTTDTRVEAPDGVHSGAITATGDGQSVRTLITVTREVESYDVTVTAIDQTGAPSVEAGYSLVDVNNPRAYSGYDPSGTSVVRVPKGEFYFEGSILTPSTPGRFKYTEFFEPVFMVTGNREVVVDARQGKPVNFMVDKPNAKVGDALFRFETSGAWGSLSSTAHIANFDDHFFIPSTTAKKDRVIFTAEAHLGEWNGKAFDGSYMYHLRRIENGALPQEFQWHYRDSKLAKVRAEYAMATPGVVGVRQRFLTVPLPSTLTEYYTPNEPWDGQFAEAIDPDSYDYVSVTEQIAPRSFPLGRTTTERWNTGVFGPAFPRGDDWYFAARLGNLLRVSLPLVTDQSRGRANFASGDGATTLLRDGVVVGESPAPGVGAFEVGSERATYTLRTSVDRSAFAHLSTQVSSEWTFTSEHVAGDPARLPLLAVRFAPNLDAGNAAPAGKPFTIPVYVQRNGADVGRVNMPSVEVSYDDGATWRAAPVSRHRGEWRTVVDHPVGAKFVSLRSSVTDPAGDSQRQTIIRAYALS